VVRAADFALWNGYVSGWTVGRSGQRGTEVLASMDHDHQLERDTILDVKPVQPLMEQLTEPLIVLASVASDARGSIEYSS